MCNSSSRYTVTPADVVGGNCKSAKTRCKLSEEVEEQNKYSGKMKLTALIAIIALCIAYFLLFKRKTLSSV